MTHSAFVIVFVLAVVPHQYLCRRIKSKSTQLDKNVYMYDESTPQIAEVAKC